METAPTSPPQASSQGSNVAGEISLPAISLPKGGGAIRGIGEKFSSNPVTGTGSLSVPIVTSPGRSGFGPKLSLSYDSGAGNGPFGLGWNLSLPAITRKTDKGLPRYNDSPTPDVYLLSGAEDLVPCLVQNTNGDWIPEESRKRTIHNSTYRIERFRPRTEGLFARIEHWTNQQDPKDNYWRSISRDNITTWYGKSDTSRIADPHDPARIFSWLICESYDDKGNVIVYEYKPENSEGVNESLAHEQNRTPTTRGTNKYLKRILYGNHKPYFPELRADQPLTPLPAIDAWHFETVFDYGEHDLLAPTPQEINQWPRRPDAFSSYRAGFETRTYRLCRRVLMFHHFEAETDVKRDCLVRSTDFSYSSEQDPASSENPIHSVLLSISQCGYKRQGLNYIKRSLPTVEFTYSRAELDERVREVDQATLENLPVGLDGRSYQWVDLDGEGLSGVLTEQAGGWFYKRNLSPINLVRQNGALTAAFSLGPLETVKTKPALAALASGRQQFLDLAGDGQLDLVEFNGPNPGFHERTTNEDWEDFKTFASLPNIDWNDPNLKFVDLTGDGHADVLITEDAAFCWYPSLAEDGFAAAERLQQSLDEEKGPRLIFADAEHSIQLADLSGDGLVDLVRIRNGEVCYWPNLGYGRFGAKVTMDNSPRFDHDDQFDSRRLQLADVDGSGVTDLIYLASKNVQIFFNQSGNSWSQPRLLNNLPPVDNLASVTAMDLLGNGTACLAWSSPLPGNTRRPMFYVDLMGGQKPHLLTRITNNLGAETEVTYAPSTRFYLLDKLAGRPWITRIPFPVHAVERITTHDQISGSRFVTRYAYHHGYFDGVEREFRGFGMVEQWDTEETAATGNQIDELSATEALENSTLPPVHTKTWFHTGVYLGRDHVSDFFAGTIDAEDRGEYYREPGLTDAQARSRLLPDTVLDADLSVAEEREACRALRGSMLRQEIFAIDETASSEYPSGQPYTVVEQNFAIRRLQPRGENQPAVFFTHPRESVSYHYERNPADPRTTHALTLEVDDYGNVRRELAIAYGRRASLLSDDADRLKQTTALITYTEHDVTNAIDDPQTQPDSLRTPLPAEVRTYELTGFSPENNAARFSFDEWQRSQFALVSSAQAIAYEQKADRAFRQKRLIEQVRSIYRANDLSRSLPLGTVESNALPWQTLKLALTPELVTAIFKRKQPGQPEQDLLPSPEQLLNGKDSDQGGYVSAEGNWWISSGRAFLDPAADVRNPEFTAAAELATARANFYQPRKVADPFDQSAFVDYDDYDLLVRLGRDALKNETLVANDYRVLQPRLITDPNGNRSAVEFDALGLVAATAIMGKDGERRGDRLADLAGNPLAVDAALGELQAFVADPESRAHDLLGTATTRNVYDLDRFRRCGQPPFGATLTRETHFHSTGGPQSPIQISFSYSDGFGREIQKKIQAEEGDARARAPHVTLPFGDAGAGELLRNAAGAPSPPVFTARRWVGTGRTVYNNKGKPVRQYEPFFSATHLYETERELTDMGVSSTLFYDPLERVVATLHPNHTYEKVVFDAWQQTNYDVNDTATSNPSADDDVKSFFIAADGAPRIRPSEYSPTWYELRAEPAHAHEAELTWPDPRIRAAERDAATKAAAHAGTPTVAHLDPLGRIFLSFADNGRDPDTGRELKFATRVELDIEGNQREVRDAVIANNDPRGRVVMRYDYDLLGNRIHQSSMEAGERWLLNDATGKTIRTWDSRGFERRLAYDKLRRPAELYVTENGAERLAERTIYGENEGAANSHRTRVYQVYDGAGIATTLAYDFKGNAVASRRELLPEYRVAVDWNKNPVADAGSFSSQTSYDALNRPVESISPDGSIYRPTFNRANLLDRVDVCLRGKLNDAKAPVWTTFVKNINYNPKGQRTLIEYQNGATTTYEYDEQTFRLIHLKTTRAGAHGDSSQIFSDPAVVQDLRYTFDPAGNITRIADAALATVRHNNEDVEPVCSYQYDALYRLIAAKGREHISQTAFDLNPAAGEQRDFQFAGHRAHANDLQALRVYTEQYDYDPVGNFKRVRHVANGGSWTRSYSYEEQSQIEDFKQSNRLTRTMLGNGQSHDESYTHDAHGNITSMPHLPNMAWDFKDQLQQIDLRGGGKAFYVYDAGGQRMRKVIESQHSAPRSERIYVAGFEVYREFSGAVSNVTLRRETLHVMDDKQRIALIETQTIKDGNAIAEPLPLPRYQLGNHLRSAAVELSDAGALISYEEFHPYGTTSFQINRDSTEGSLKRYRYTGKERDEESGFSYQSARYYVPWLASWASADPVGVFSSTNLYSYVIGNPIKFLDSTGRQEQQIDAGAETDKRISTPEELENAVKNLAPNHSFNPIDENFVTRRLGKNEIAQREGEGAFSVELKQFADHACMINAVRFVVQKEHNVMIGSGGQGDRVMFSLIEKYHVDQKKFDAEFTNKGRASTIGGAPNMDLDKAEKWLAEAGVETKGTRLITDPEGLFSFDKQLQWQGDILFAGQLDGTHHTFVIHEARQDDGRIEVRVYNPWEGKNLRLDGEETDWIDLEAFYRNYGLELDENGKPKAKEGQEGYRADAPTYFQILEVQHKPKVDQIPSPKSVPMPPSRFGTCLPP